MSLLTKKDGHLTEKGKKITTEVGEFISELLGFWPLDGEELYQLKAVIWNSISLPIESAYLDYHTLKRKEDR